MENLERKKLSQGCHFRINFVVVGKSSMGCPYHPQKMWELFDQNNGRIRVLINKHMNRNFTFINKLVIKITTQENCEKQL